MNCIETNDFPVVVHWLDTNESEMICTSDEISSERPFKVLARRVIYNPSSSKDDFMKKWGVYGMPRDKIRLANAAWDSGHSK